MKLEISEHAAGLIGFKGAVYSADAWDPASSNAQDDKEWSGLYIAEDETTAKGYLPDAVATGNAYIHKVGLKENVHIITCLDEGFKAGNINIKQLKEALRDNNIPVDDNELLMPTLGKLKFLFKCYNNEEGSLEIIVPNSMCNYIYMQDYKKCELKNYEVLYCHTF